MAEKGLKREPKIAKRSTNFFENKTRHRKLESIPQPVTGENFGIFFFKEKFLGGLIDHFWPQDHFLDPFLPRQGQKVHFPNAEKS